MSVFAEPYRRSIPFLILAVACALPLVAAASADEAPRPVTRDGPAAGPEPAPAEREIEVDPNGYTGSRTCGECHVDIYRSWKKSMHAFALSDPIFDGAYMQALKIGGDDAKRLCLRCHAPLTQVNEDYDLKLGITREGVTCDFCHTVTAVHVDGREKPFSTDPGSVKRSVLRTASSPAHEVAYSELHGTAEFCGGCHNYTAPSGVALMSTYDEWRAGPYAREGVPCQSCHMSLSPGRVAKVGNRTAGTEFHLHDLIHDRDQLRSALEVEIVRTQRTSRGLEVEVVVENVGSGHSVPTGVPTREVVLTVEATAGKRNLVQQRRYHKVVADAEGRVLDTDAEALIHGAVVLDDNRIKPRERRRERFVFSLPPNERVTLSARLSYEYSPMILKQQELNIRLSEAVRVVD